MGWSTALFHFLSSFLIVTSGLQRVRSRLGLGRIFGRTSFVTSDHRGPSVGDIWRCWIFWIFRMISSFGYFWNQYQDKLTPEMLEVDFFNFGASECLHHGWNCECSCFQRQVCCLMKWETIKLELSCIKDNEEIIGRSSEKCPNFLSSVENAWLSFPK